MLNFLNQESNITYTENGGTAYRSSESYYLDMFFQSRSYEKFLRKRHN